MVYARRFALAWCAKGTFKFLIGMLKPHRITSQSTAVIGHPLGALSGHRNH